MSGLKTVESWAKRAGVVLIGGALILSTMGLGGCNNKLKEENEMLRTENAELKERSLTAEQRAVAASGQVENLSRQNQDLSSQLAAKQQELATRAQPAPGADAGFYGSDTAGGSTARSGGGRSGGGASNRSANRTIEISGDVLFASGQVTLKPESRRELDQVVRRIQREFPDSNLIIEGHTDSDPIRKSRFKSNEALSKARADAVAAYLAQKGISRSRIDTVGKGSSEPRRTKAASRRVEIIVVD